MSKPTVVSHSKFLDIAWQDIETAFIMHPSGRPSGSLLPPTSRMNVKRSSIFEIPEGFIRPAAVGSSVMSFACEPKHLEDQDLPSHRQKKTLLENTYRMEPPAKFRSDLVTPIIKDVLENSLEGRVYDHNECSLLCKSMSQEIKTKAKQLDFKRYKLVSMVTVGEKNDQALRIGSRCVWDTDRDTFSSATFENSTLYAVGVLFAIYYE